jgi:hypothetical protein
MGSGASYKPLKPTLPQYLNENKELGICASSRGQYIDENK